MSGSARNPGVPPAGDGNPDPTMPRRAPGRTREIRLPADAGTSDPAAASEDNAPTIERGHRPSSVSGRRNSPPPPARQSGRTGRSVAPPETLARTLADSERPASRYRFGEELGRGGLGVVRLAQDTMLLRDVAVKLLLEPDDRELREAFVEEAQITGQLEHPNIVPVHELGEDGQGRPFLTMKRIHGRTLREVIDETDRELRGSRGTPAIRPDATSEEEPTGSPATATLRRLLLIFLKVCDAMAYAHSRRVIHRDLKPENIMVGDYGEVLVVDWGLARPLDTQRDARRSGDDVDPATSATIRSGRREGGAMVTLQGEVFGTPAYMPPEQASGDTDKLDERSDIYSLGAILWQILVGAPPFSGTVDHILQQVARNQVAQPSARAPRHRTVPRELEAVVMKAMAGRRGHRYATVEELRADVDAFLAGRALSAADYTGWQLLAKWAARHKGAVLTASVAVLVLIAVVAVFIVGLNEERNRANQEAHRAREAEQTATAEAERARTEEERARTEEERAETEADQARTARDEAARARTDAEQAAETAKHEARRAREAERDARLALGRSLAARGDALLLGERFLEAEAQYLDSAAIFHELGHETILAELGLDTRYRLAPPPLLYNRAHANMVSMALSPDDSLLITTGAEDMALWDVATGRLRRQFKLQGALSSLAFAPDNSYLAGITVAADVLLFELPSFRRLPSLKSGSNQALTDLAISPDGTRIAAAGGDQTLYIWNVNQPDAPASTSSGEHFRPIRRVAWSPDGRFIATGGIDHQVRIWDGRTGALVHRLYREEHLSHVYSLAFTPDGAHLYSGGLDSRLVMWDTATGQVVRKAPGFKGWTFDIAVTPDGSKVLTASRDARVHVHDVATGELITRLVGHGQGVYRLAISHDGTFVVTGCDDGRWSLYRVPDKGRDDRIQLEDLGAALAISPDGRLLATGEEGLRSKVKLWDVATHTLLRSIPTEGRITSVAFSPDGRLLAACGLQGAVRVWDLQSGDVVFEQFEDMREPGSRYGISGLVFSTDGGLLAWAGHRAVVHVVDMTRKPPQESRRLAGMHQNEVSALAFIDESRLAAADFTARVVLSNAATGQAIAELKGHRAPLYGVAASADGRWVASGSADHTVRVWDVATARESRVLNGHRSTVRAVAFLPDGRHLASAGADGTVRVWDLTSGDELCTWEDHTAEVCRLVVSRDGRTIASSASDKTVCVRHVGLGHETRAAKDRLERISAASPDAPLAADDIRWLADWYASRRAWGLALRLYERAATLGDSPPHLALARCHWQLGHADDARREFRSAIAADEASRVWLELCLESLGN